MFTPYIVRDDQEPALIIANVIQNYWVNYWNGRRLVVLDSAMVRVMELDIKVDAS
jgi:hypothetical protein